MSEHVDVTALRDSLVEDLHQARMHPSQGSRIACGCMMLADALIAAVRADATRAAEAEVAGLRAALAGLYKSALAFRARRPWDSNDPTEKPLTDALTAALDALEEMRKHPHAAALAAQHAAPEAEPVRKPCPDGDNCPDARRWGDVHPKPAPEAEPERCATLLPGFDAYGVVMRPCGEPRGYILHEHDAECGTRKHENGTCTTCHDFTPAPR